MARKDGERAPSGQRQTPRRLCRRAAGGQIVPVTSPVPPPDRVGLWLFRWRSYTPLVLLGTLVAAVASDPIPAGGAWTRPLWVGGGMGVGLLGLAVRGCTAGMVPRGTSGRATDRPRASSLNTAGAYSVVRHPLYLGNALLWLGVALVSGRPGAAVLVAVAFGIIHQRIIRAEERFLYAEFGAAFEAWADRTPAIFPRFSGWVPSPHPFSLRFALGRDYPALYAFVTSTTALELTRSVASGEGWRLGSGWWAYASVGTVWYGVLHVLKRTTRVLEAEDR